MIVADFCRIQPIFVLTFHVDCCRVKHTAGWVVQHAEF